MYRWSCTHVTRVSRCSLPRRDDDRVNVRPWREGVFYDDQLRADFFAFTLDKTSGAVLSYDALSRLRDQSRADSLGEPIDYEGR